MILNAGNNFLITGNFILNQKLQMKILTLLLFLPFAVKAQSVSGTVTHSFKSNATAQPDAGAKVYLFKYEGDAIGIYERINNFLNAKNYREGNGNAGRQITILKDSADVIKGRRKYEKEYAAFQKRIEEIKAASADRTAKLQVLNAETNVKFDAFDQQSARALSLAKLKAADMRTPADTTGNFNLKASPGNYAVMIVSNNRTGFSTTEAPGEIYLVQTEIKEGETVKVNAHFIKD